MTLRMMSNPHAHSHTSIRRIAAVVMLCVFVLRGMTLIGMAAALASSPSENPVFAHAVIGEQCAPHDESNEAPKSNHSEQHCVLCSPLARDAIALITFVFICVAVFAPRKPVGTRSYFKEPIYLARPPGLIANWSATSPPRPHEI
jgi:hypothetical protein